MSKEQSNELRKRIRASGINVNKYIVEGEYEEAQAWAEDCVDLISRLFELEAAQSQEVAE